MLRVAIALLTLVGVLIPDLGWGVSKISQPAVPDGLNTVEGAILEDNDTFFTFMTHRAVRVLSKTEAKILERDEKGDGQFIAEHRNENGDYWYWAHMRAREALIMALGSQPEEAIKMLNTIPYSEALVPEYRWIASPEFREYLGKASDDLAYYYDPYVGINVFVTNYQVSQLDPEYPKTKITSGPNRGQTIQAKIPILEFNLRDLVATPRVGEEETVGLNALLEVAPEGITDSLLPASKEYAERKTRLQEKVITAPDWQRKRIPVSTREVRDLLQPLMSESQKSLRIRGTMRETEKSTTFEDLKIEVNEESGLAVFLKMHRLAFKGAEIKKAK